MGYVKDTVIGIPLSVLLYLLIEKMIIVTTCEDQFSERVQKTFVISLVVGLAMIGLGLSIFGTGKLKNGAMEIAFYGTGGLLIFTSTVFNWDKMDDQTKIVILGIVTLYLIMYSYHKNK